jgi:hypothetical protein
MLSGVLLVINYHTYHRLYKVFQDLSVVIFIVTGVFSPRRGGEGVMFEL